jgi:hypothetical protein
MFNLEQFNLTYYYGCTSDYLTNNNDTVDNTTAPDILKRILTNYPDHAYKLLLLLVQENGQETYHDYCETCGDTPYTVTLTLT